MERLEPSEAIETARTQLGLATEVPAVAEPVLRLDRQASYYLVSFGEADAAVAVAAVDAESGSVLSSARLGGRNPHLAVSAATALHLAGTPPEAPVRLVWAPVAPSRSPLYPFWQVGTPHGTIYVDQQQRIWTDLTLMSRGG